MLACLAALGVVVSGVSYWREQRPVRVPELGNWSDAQVAKNLVEAIVRKVPSGGRVLVLHWRGGLGGRRAKGLETGLSAAGLQVVPLYPPPQLPSGNGDEKISITMEDAGVPPQFLIESFRQHPDSAAMVVLLNLSGPVPPDMIASLPLLFLDENTEFQFPWREPAHAGRFGAVIARKPAKSWSVEKALDAGPEAFFAMRYELVSP